MFTNKIFVFLEKHLQFSFFALVNSVGFISRYPKYRQCVRYMYNPNA